MTGRNRYRLDQSVRRHGTTVVGGSPLRLFRLTTTGARVVDRIAAGETVPDSALVARLLDAGAIHPDPAGDGPFGVDDVTVVVPTLGPPTHVPDRALVVDDGSSPPVPGAAIRLPDNRGPAAARNAGLDTVTTPLVAFVDADVRVPERWLERLLPHFVDPLVGLVAPRVRSTSGDGALAAYEAVHSPLDLGTEPARVRAGSRVSYVPAAVIVCRVDALREIGGFDTGLRYGEDVDLVWRLDEAGWRCRYEPGCVVDHDPRPHWRAWARQRIAYGSSAGPLARRHPGALAPLRTNGWSLGAWGLTATGHPLAGAAIGLGSSAALVAKLPDVPAGAAFRLAAVGNLRAGDQIAVAVRRAWWPLLAVAAVRSRTARSVLTAAAVAARHPIRLADDIASSIGLWRGMVVARTLAPIQPDITSWPGRRRSSPPADDHR